MAEQLILEIQAAIAEDERIHPVSGGLNREHWRDILARHTPLDDWDLRCRQCYEGSPWPCTDLLSLARRHGIEAGR